MKQYGSILLTVLLAAALFTGCGCTNRDTAGGTQVTILPTNGETMPASRPDSQSSRPTSSATTATSSTRATDSTRATTATTPTVDNGNGPLEDMTDPPMATDNTQGARQNVQGTD